MQRPRCKQSNRKKSLSRVAEGKLLDLRGHCGSVVLRRVVALAHPIRVGHHLRPRLMRFLRLMQR